MKAAWLTREGVVIYIDKMTTNHIEAVINILRTICYYNSSKPYNGRTYNEWLSLFTRELKERNTKIIKLYKRILL